MTFFAVYPGDMAKNTVSLGLENKNERATQRITNKNYKFISLNKLSKSVTMCYPTEPKCIHTHTIEKSK